MKNSVWFIFILPYYGKSKAGASIENPIRNDLSESDVMAGLHADNNLEMTVFLHNVNTNS